MPRITRHRVEDGSAQPPVKRSFGQELIEAAKQALAIARGEADPSTYQVWAPKDGRMVRVDSPRVIRSGRVLSTGGDR